MLTIHKVKNKTVMVNSNWEENEEWSTMNKISLAAEKEKAKNKILFYMNGSSAMEPEIIETLDHIAYVSKQEKTEEILAWIKKLATKSVRAGVLGYDFVSRLEKKLEEDLSRREKE